MSELMIINFHMHRWEHENYPYIVVTDRAPEEVGEIVTEAVETLEEKYCNEGIEEHEIENYIESLNNITKYEDVYFITLPEVRINL